MNTIEESTEISCQTQADQVNGKSSTITTKTITNSSSSSYNTTSASPATATNANGNGNGNGDSNVNVNNTPTPTPNGSPSSPVNGVSTSSSEDYLEDLKILGHLKNIEKLNEKRRVFLSNSLKAEFQSDEKSETKNKKKTEKLNGNGNDVGDVQQQQQQQQQQQFTAYNEKRTLVREHQIDQSVSAEADSSVLQKYATLPIKSPPRSPLSPPPKPPMLSRTRSIGVGDSLTHDTTPVSSPLAIPKFAPPPTPTNNVPTYMTTDPTTNIQIQPAESAIITKTKLAEPVKVTCIQLNDTVADTMNIEGDQVALRTSKTSEHTTNGPSSDMASLGFREISSKHYERLIEELKCPGCAYPMKTPVYLCKTGHSICEQCTRILMLCPLCKVS